MKKTTKLFAVMTAAACLGMIPAFGGQPAVNTAYAANYGWTQEDDSLVYYDEDGYLVTDSWRKNGEDWFYLNEDGQIARNTKIDDYYVGEDGKMVKNTWMELRNEEDPDSPDMPASFWYYFDEDGKAAASRWMKLDSKWYYFDEYGHMQTGKTEIGGSSYYLGSDGSMRTGWMKLEDSSAAPGASENWHYFNSDGKMVETQYDKKIDGSYYTFIDGKMQTGWVRMPAENEDSQDSTASVSENQAPAAQADAQAPAGETGTETQAASAETGTQNQTSASNAQNAASSIASYQYYGESNDGKRADGFRTIEGIKGIHDMDETYTFYFKSGKPYFSSVKGNELFSIDGKRYAFNDLGEMQTGQKVVNIGNGETANFYFDDNGIMETGKQTIYNEETGENENWFFYTDGDKKGQGYHGLYNNVLYLNGKRAEATADQKYAPVEFNGVTYLVNSTGSIQKASSSSSSSEKPELGRGFKDYRDSNGTVWVVDGNGIVQ